MQQTLDLYRREIAPSHDVTLTPNYSNNVTREQPTKKVITLLETKAPACK